MISSLGLPRAAMGILPLTLCTLLSGYSVFHLWLWRRFHLIFPACRASSPCPWRMMSAHRATLSCIWRMATCFWRRVPDVFLIGAAKGGTSALYTYLCLHPGVEASVWKESRFLHGLFGRRLWRHLSPWLYRSCFPMGRKITVEADPSMCLIPELAAAFIKWMSPQAKVVLCCREPVSRAFSMYKFVSRLRGRREYGRSFREVLEFNQQWLDEAAIWDNMKATAKDLEGGALSVKLPTDLNLAIIGSPMLKGGHYAEIYRSFQAWNQNGRRDLHVVRFSDLVHHTERSVRDVFRFLSLDPGVPLPDLDKVMPEDVMDFLVVDKGISENGQSELSKEERLVLEDYYRVRNQEFADLLGKRLDDLW